MIKLFAQVTYKFVMSSQGWTPMSQNALKRQFGHCILGIIWNLSFVIWDLKEFFLERNRVNPSELGQR